MSAGGQCTKWCRNIAENFNRLSRAHERYRQTDRLQTDGRPMTYSERERLKLIILTIQTENDSTDRSRT